MNALAHASSSQSNGSVVAKPTNDNVQYLTFMLGGEMFAIGILGVKEIIEYGNLTEVPMMPACIRGVINLRGSVVAVMDLSERFGKESMSVTKRTCVVIVEIKNNDEQLVVGIVVDAVNAVLEIAPSEIEPAPTFGAKIRADFIAGMGKINNKFVILLNVDNIVAIEEIGALTGSISSRSTHLIIAEATVETPLNS